MCLLVARKQGSSWTPTREEFDNAWSSNPHGFGASWKSDQLWINKSLDKEDAWRIICNIPAGAAAIYHWRMATHGEKTLENCHPWPIFKGQWCGAHNGVLSSQRIFGTMTDSQSFMMTLTGTEPRMHGIEKAISRLGYGKMAFISQQGEIRIANEHQGSWRIQNEVWQSNSGLDARPYISNWGWSDENYVGSYRPIGFHRGNTWKPKKHNYVAIKCEYCSARRDLFKVANSIACDDCVELAEADEHIVNDHTVNDHTL